MTRIRSQVRPIATVCAVAYVLGVIFAPAIAFACEGGGGEGEQEGKKILLNNTFAKFQVEEEAPAQKNTNTRTTDRAHGRQARLPLCILKEKWLCGTLPTNAMQRFLRVMNAK